MFENEKFDRAKFEANRVKEEFLYKRKCALSEMLIQLADEEDKPVAELSLYHQKVTWLVNELLFGSSLAVSLANELPMDSAEMAEARKQIHAYVGAMIQPLKDVHRILSELHTTNPLPEFINQPKND